MSEAQDAVLATLAEALCDAPQPTLVWGERLEGLAELAADAGPLRGYTDDLPTSRSLGYPIGLRPEPGPERRVALVMPRAKALLDLRVAEARALLADGGEIWVAGHQQDGVRSAETLLGELGPVEVVHVKRRCRVAVVRLEPSPASVAPDLALHEARVAVPGRHFDLELVTLPGVFSHGRLDAATEALLGVLDAREPGYRRALDVGCGGGVLGAWAARRRPRATVDLVDVSALACEAARRTLAANGVEGHVHLGEPEELAKAAWDLVISNPPRHEGRDHAHDLTARLIDASAWRLGRGGRYFCVANHAKSVTEALERNFRTVEVAVQAPAFRVWDCTR